MRFIRWWHLRVAIIALLVEKVHRTCAFTTSLRCQRWSTPQEPASCFASQETKFVSRFSSLRTGLQPILGVNRCSILSLAMANPSDNDKTRPSDSDKGQRFALGNDKSRPGQIAPYTYQEAALSGLLSDGQLVPDDWLPGEHFDYSEEHTFNFDEMAVVLCNGGSVRFGRIISRNADKYTVNIGGASFRSKNTVELAASELGKILLLSAREIQRLGIPRPAREGDQQRGLLASLKSVLDVDKQMASDSLPFQPMFSRRSSGPPPQQQQPGSTAQDEAAQRSLRQKSSGGAGRPEGWGELLGWWQDGRAVIFQVEINRPIGMELDEVEGEGVLVTRVEEGGNAQQAGMRVGDRVEVSARAGAGWSGELGVVLSAVASRADTVRLRFSREQEAAGAAQIWRERSAAEVREGAERRGEADAVLELRVEKPMGMRLTEIPGEGIVVEAVTKGGNAERAGVQVGDRIVSSSAAPGYESGIEFDRGTTYMAAQYKRTQRSSLEAFLANVKSGGGQEVVVGVERLGKESLERRQAARKLGAVDAQLSAKVKGRLLGPLALYDGTDGDVIPEVPAAPNRALKVNLDLMSYRARQHVIRREFKDAEKLYRRCIRLDPYDGRGWLGLSRSLRKRRMDLQAREVLIDGLLRNPENPHLLQALGTLEKDQGNTARAMARFDEALAADPSHAASWVAKGQLEERQKRTERARECYMEATAVAPKNYYAWQCLAVLESRDGHVDKARALFRTCAELRPENAAVWQAWGVMEQREGRVDDARAHFERGLAARPHNTFVLQALGCLEWDCGNVTGGRALLERAIALNGRDGGVYQAYATRLWKHGMVSKARDKFAEGAAAAKRHTAIWQAWGLMEARLGHVDKARSLFQQGVWDAGNAKAIHTLWQAWGVLEAENGNMDKARQYFTRAVESSKRPAPSLVAWSRAEENQGRYGKARELLERGVRVEPYNWRVWDCLIALERRVGGRGCPAERDAYKRKVLAEMYHAKQKQDWTDGSEPGTNNLNRKGLDSESAAVAPEGASAFASVGPWLSGGEGGADGTQDAGSGLVPKRT